MGREIRRVTSDWIHPRDAGGDYIPLYDKDYKTASKEWKSGLLSWENGTHPTLQKHPEYKNQFEFWEWDGTPPDHDAYREAWTEEPTCYQIYETVSEGTPVSPIFSTVDEMKTWLIAQGHSEKAATVFIETGWAPSMVYTPEKGFVVGIDGLDSCL